MSKMRSCTKAGILFVLWAATAVALPAQTFERLHSFKYTDGWAPWAPLVQASDGNLYGTVSSGGNPSCSGGGYSTGCGTVFQITPGGKLTTVFFFDGTNGSAPQAGLVQAANGDFYGSTFAGGTGNFEGLCPNNCGTIFTVTANGTFTMLHAFENTDGSLPYAGLVQGYYGDFYGVTEEGGTYSYGTVFKITPSGTLTTLHSFSGGLDGDTPTSTLIQATDGNLYGTASYDGLYPNFGTVFKITTSGELTTLFNFDSKDGSYPYAALVQATNGGFYGTTYDGGGSRACPYGYGCGTVFSLSVGLGPF